MGHRTNYAIRQDGELSLYYSHWGALTVPQDVFWGPESAEAFIRQNEAVPPDAWLESEWAEGGAALDKDTKTIALFGGDALRYPPLQPVFEELMRAAWARWGWKVRWVEAVGDIAEQVGLERSVAESEPLPPTVFDLDTVIERWREDAYVCGIVSVQLAEGWQDRALSLAVGGVLANGAALLERLDDLPTLEEAGAAHYSRELASWEDELPQLGDQFSSGAVIDVPRQTISIWADYLPKQDIAHIRQQWDGWTIEYHDGLEEHFARTGRARPENLPLSNPAGSDAEPEMSEDEALAEIAAILIDEERGDPIEMIHRIVAQHAAEGTDIQVNPRALQPPVDARPDPDTRRALFSQAVAELVGRRE